MNNREQYVDPWETMTSEAKELLARARACAIGARFTTGETAKPLSTDEWDRILVILSTLNRNVER